MAFGLVVRAEKEVSSSELIQFAATRVSARKVPRRVVFAERIPVGPTGKPQRHRMAEQLGLEGVAEDEPTEGPPSELEGI